VLTQPDRPAGRGQKLVALPVKARALDSGLRLLQPSSLRDPAVQRELEALQPDVIVVAAYGLILPQAVLDMARLGCLNIHASLLPRWRGAAPIVRAIQAGDRESGVCIMKMEAGLDTGPVAITRVTPIHASDNAGSLHDRLAALGAEAIVEALDALAAEEGGRALNFVPQPTEGVTYARKVDKGEARIDWRRSAVGIADHVRAFDPQPGASSALARQPEVALRFFAPAVVAEGAGEAVAAAGEAAAPAGKALNAPGAEPADPASPGRVLAVTDQGLLIATGSGILGVAELQRAGGRRLPAAEFVRGHGIQAGDFLLSSDPVRTEIRGVPP